MDHEFVPSIGVALLDHEFGPSVGVGLFRSSKTHFFGGPNFTSPVLDRQNLDHLLEMLLRAIYMPKSDIRNCIDQFRSYI